MSDPPGPPRSSFPKFPAVRLQSLVKPDPGAKKTSTISFMPNIPTEPQKKVAATPATFTHQKRDHARPPGRGPPGMYKGKGGPPGMGGNRFAPNRGAQQGPTWSTAQTAVSAPSSSSTVVEPPKEPQKRKQKQYHQEDIAPTAQSMAIDPLDLSHPLTLPFLDPHKANPSLLNKLSSPLPEHAGQPTQKTTAAEVNPMDALDATEQLNPANLLFKGERGNYEGEDQVFFIQMPSSVPIGREPPKSQNPDETSEILGFKGTLAHLPSGNIGKLLLYKSGKVKLKIGDVLFDVSTGMPCNFLQEVVALSPEQKKFYQLGDISKKMVCYPDVGSLLETREAEENSNEMQY